MYEQLLERIEKLIAEGEGAVRSNSREDHWVRDVVTTQAWLASAANAIQQIAPGPGIYSDELHRHTTGAEMRHGIPVSVQQKILGLLRSLRDEAKAGLLAKLEYQVFATAFDDFLDHASEFQKTGKLKEAGILAASVLEDTLKRVARKNGVDPAGKTLDPLIDELTKLNVFNAIRAKRLKAYAGVRNAAFHAEWDKLTLKDVGDLIDGTRGLLEEHL
jgi:uncharacterized protein YutE (UPF0331/DUF86 family)